MHIFFRQVNLSVPAAFGACFAAQPRTKSGAAPAPRGLLVIARAVRQQGEHARAVLPLRAAAPPRLWSEALELGVLHELGEFIKMIPDFYTYYKNIA